MSTYREKVMDVKEMPGRRVFISYQHGCARRTIDTQLIYEYFKLNNWKIVKNLSEADLIVISTCAFNQMAEDAAIACVTKLQRKKRKNVEIVVAGCLGKINGERLSKIGKFTTISPQTLDDLDKIIKARISIKDLGDPFALDGFWSGEIFNFSDKERYLSKIREVFSHSNVVTIVTRIIKNQYGYNFFKKMYSRGTKLIRISEGCINNCSYCAIRFAVGQLRSKLSEKILSEFDNALDRGYKRFCLVAADVGSYGLDIGTNIVQLLEAMCARKRDFQIMLFDINMRWLTKYQNAFIDILKKNPGRITDIFCPIQSGSDRVLALMKRHYEISGVVDCLKQIKEVAPRMKLSTDIMVGFPGEKQEDLLKTLELIKVIQWDNAQVFKYTDKIGTEACNFPDKVAEEVKENNYIKMLKLLNRNGDF